MFGAGTEGRDFIGWKVSGDDKLYQPGDKVPIEQDDSRSAEQDDDDWYFNHPATNVDVTITAQWGMRWSDLQKEIDAANPGATITLSCDVTAEPADTDMVVPRSQWVILDLNGHTLNRNARNTNSSGSAIDVRGRLKVIDSSAAKTGSITGGFAKLGGGIIIRKDAKVELENVKITGNAATVTGGGIYAEGLDSAGDALTVSGNVQITGNIMDATAFNRANNVRLGDSA